MSPSASSSPQEAKSLKLRPAGLLPQPSRRPCGPSLQLGCLPLEPSAQTWTHHSRRSPCACSQNGPRESIAVKGLLVLWLCGIPGLTLYVPPVASQVLEASTIGTKCCPRGSRQPWLGGTQSRLGSAHGPFLSRCRLLVTGSPAWTSRHPFRPVHALDVRPSCSCCPLWWVAGRSGERWAKAASRVLQGGEKTLPLQACSESFLLCCFATVAAAAATFGPKSVLFVLAQIGVWTRVGRQPPQSPSQREGVCWSTKRLQPVEA